MVDPLSIVVSSAFRLEKACVAERVACARVPGELEGAGDAEDGARAVGAIRSGEERRERALETRAGSARVAQREERLAEDDEDARGLDGIFDDVDEHGRVFDGGARAGDVLFHRALERGLRQHARRSEARRGERGDDDRLLRIEGALTHALSSADPFRNRRTAGEIGTSRAHLRSTRAREHEAPMSALFREAWSSLLARLA